MNSIERLLQCKVKLGIKSDYALAKALGINRGSMTGYMTGKRQPDAYMAVKMAEVLGVHPMLLLAEFEAETEKNPDKRAFWENFGQRIKSGLVGIVVLICSAFWLPEQRAGASVLDAHNVYYVKLFGGINSAN
jgi:transcriptional regulator with XRE-family HTH domain